MTWYHLIAYFLAGIFVVNGIPHLLMGLTGRKFPTPFAKPAGIGDSTAVTNVVWALFNLFVGYLLLQPGSFETAPGFSMFAFLAGIAGMSLMLARHFGGLYSPQE